MNTFIDLYKGIQRLRSSNGRVLTGLVSCTSMGCWHGIYEVRENGIALKRVSGLSKKTLSLAKEVALRNGLADTNLPIHPHFV